MNIGIDVDAVLLDWEKGLLAMAEIFDIEECRGSGKVNDTYFIQDQYDWTTDEKEKFKNKYFLRLSEESNIMPGAIEVIHRLQKRGHKVIIISTRGTETEEMINIVANKFKENNLTFDKYFWKEHNKLKVCKEENIDIMIDDSPSTCTKMQENKIRTIYFRGLRGKKLNEDEYLKEVNNWGQIYRILKEV